MNNSSEKGVKYNEYGRRIPNRSVFEKIMPIKKIDTPLDIQISIETSVPIIETSVPIIETSVPIIETQNNNNKFKLIDESIIPLNIFQTWHSLDIPEKMRETVEKIKNDNPEFTHYLFDDTMCENFIEQHFDFDILYTFRKLRPGAYKSDLWRYCVLYIHGGIYLDIKFHCINEFKFIYLTDKEYWVRDREQIDIHGIYQALLVCLPYNTILWNSILEIVKNVKENYYENELMITGPLLVSKFFYQYKIKEFDLFFSEDGKNIYYKDKDTPILQVYSEYREEQNKYARLNYYRHLHNEKDIYEYPILQNIREIEITRKITKIIKNQNITLFSSNPCIISSPTNPNEYILNIRWINYNYNVDGSKKTIPSPWISLNSHFKINTQFQQITKEVFLEEDFKIQEYYCGIGLEDIRMFYFEPENQVYYSASYFDDSRKCTSSSCDKYVYHPTNYTLNRNIILCDFYDIHKNKKLEKNWAYFNYQNELRVVYKWSPISIGKIDFEKSQLSIVEYKYQVPDFFKEVRGSTPGIIFENEIWFILHKTQSYHKLDKNIAYNYQHFFAIFDRNMNLLRYSELFKFKGTKVEFCVGFIIEEERIIISYSALDTNCFIAIYEKKILENQLKWYTN